MKPPAQLRCETHLDSMVLTLGGIRDDHWWQRHPVYAGLLALLASAGLVALHAYLAGLIAAVVLLGYNHFSTGNPEQQRVRIERDRIRFHHLDLDLRTLQRIELTDESGPILEFFGPEGQPLGKLYMQLEPMHHGRWLRAQLLDLRNKGRARTGTAREVPRELRQLADR